MSIAREFREFAVKGNVVDMAVGIIIGAAFGRIVSSFVNDMVTPPLGYLIGGVDFTDLAVTLPAMQEGRDAVTINYGAFLQTTFDFLIVAFAIFLVIKAINRMKPQGGSSADCAAAADQGRSAAHRDQRPVEEAVARLANRPTGQPSTGRRKRRRVSGQRSAG